MLITKNRLIQLFLIGLMLLFLYSQTVHASLDIYVRANPSTAVPGEPVLIEAHVSNVGTASESAVELEIDWPDLLGMPVDVSVNSSFSNNKLIMQIGDLESGAYKTVSLVARLNYSVLTGSVVNINTIATHWNNALNLREYSNQAATNLLVQTFTQLPVAIDFGDSVVVSGQIKRLFLRYANNTASPLKNAELTAHLGSHLTFVAASSNGILLSGNKVSWDKGTVARGAAGEMWVDVLVDSQSDAFLLQDITATLTGRLRGLLNHFPAEAQYNGRQYGIDSGPVAYQGDYITTISNQWPISNSSGVNDSGVINYISEGGTLGYYEEWHGTTSGVSLFSNSAQYPVQTVDAFGGDLDLVSISAAKNLNGLSLNPKAHFMGLKPVWDFFLGYTGINFIIPESTITMGSVTLERGKIYLAVNLLQDQFLGFRNPFDESKADFQSAPFYGWYREIGEISEQQRADYFYGAIILHKDRVANQIKITTYTNLTGEIAFQFDENPQGVFPLAIIGQRWGETAYRSSGIWAYKNSLPAGIVSEISAQGAAWESDQYSITVNGEVNDHNSGAISRIHSNPLVSLRLDLDRELALPGQSIMATLTITNLSSQELNNPELYLRLPLTPIAENNLSDISDSGSCNGNTCGSGELVKWALETLAPGETRVLNFVSGAIAGDPGANAGNLMRWQAWASVADLHLGDYERFLYITDVDTDSDADGISDLIETNTGNYIDGSNTGSDPFNADTDGDGMDDSFELLYGLLLLDASDAVLDFDKDGISNLVEFQNGTDPTIINATGDSDGNGDLDIRDLLMVTHHILGINVLEQEALSRSDVYPPGSPDGLISASDLLFINKAILKH